MNKIENKKTNKTNRKIVELFFLFDNFLKSRELFPLIIIVIFFFLEII
jgi:hypothetical protein